MKNLFYNSKGFNTATITFQSKERLVKVNFQLNDNPIQHKWQSLYLDSCDIKTDPMSNLGTDGLSKLLKESFNSLGIEVNDPPYTQDQLNEFHHRFVESSQSNEKFQLINLLIHKIEGTINDPFVDYNCSIHFNKTNEEYFDIEQEHKLWLVTDFKWGDLLLGYGTLGRDWLELFDSDDSVNDLNVQSKMNSEGIAFFHVENPHTKHKEKFFYPWAKEIGAPLDNLNQLSLGRYILGQVIIDDTFLNFHANASDWYVPNHACKLKWNKEFIGPDTKIVNVEFFDSDLYYNSLIKHSQFEEVLCLR